MENNILSKLKDDEKRFLNVVTCKKGTVISREGDICNAVFFVVSGQVKISSTSFEGNERVFNVVDKNEVFGNNLLFSDSPTYKGDVIATKDSTIVSISKINLLTILQCNREFLTSYLNVQSNFGKKLNATIQMLSITSAEERFKLYLYQNDGLIEFHSIVDLANVLHMQRETLSRLLTKLEKENVIARSPHQIQSID